MNVKRLLLGLIVLTVGLSQANADLVALYRFDEEANPQPDSSQFGNHAEVIEATWVNDPDRGGVMQFEGQGDNVPEQWLEAEDSDSLSIEIEEGSEDGLSIVAWANFVQFDTWNSILAKTGESSQNKPSPYDVYTHRGGDGRVQFFVGEGNAAITANTSEGPAEAEVWTHIAVTLDGEGEVVHYLDGEENGLGFVDLISNPLIDEDQNLFIGSRLDGTTNMDGLLDDVAIFNHALTEEEVVTVMGGDFSAYLGGGLVGDFDGSGVLDEPDINILTQAIIDGSMDTQYDLNGDGNVDDADRGTWVNDLRCTWFGDSNLDGEFNSADFVQVFQRGQYEDATAGNSQWGDGDWNGDADFNSSDFVTAFQAGGYEVGPRIKDGAAVAAVPEPSALILILLGLLPVFGRLRN